jgi:inosine-uridine nucleoside N-ribohydrolase
MTNVALAVRMDDSFASLAKEFVIMGGYVDDNMYQATGTVNEADINSDINLMIDPEAAKIALTANFPSITIAGNVANQVISTQEFLDDVYEEKNLYSKLMFWDETAAALMVDPSLATNTSTGRFSSLHSLSLVVVRKLLINCDSLLGCRYCLWITFV